MNSVKLTRIQKLIGQRMLKSKQEKPCFYIRLKADVTGLMGMRHKLSKSAGPPGDGLRHVKITTNAFYIRALAMAAKKYPLMLGIFAGDYIKVADAINIGFAVSAAEGLFVPVIKNADTRSLAEIARLEKELTEKARANKLTLEDMEGETIALSNLGSYGLDWFLGIVPPPASTILAVGNVIKELVPFDGKPTARKMVSLSLAADARIIQAPYAAEFLNFIKSNLENPDDMVRHERANSG
jgi:pyruvate/2-oxoglutarate dehydrogenase complex dihydrolipoamide acyltransferase (E2) component